jgi:hypothetical protein
MRKLIQLTKAAQVLIDEPGWGDALGDGKASVWHLTDLARAIEESAAEASA